MEKCRVGDVRSTLIGRLSKGYRQRVGLAQAILANPEVLILDEPTAGLDPKQIIETRELIKGLGGDHTIILSTHILPEVSMTCGRVVIINKGRVVAEDTPGQPDPPAAAAPPPCASRCAATRRPRRARCARCPGCWRCARRDPAGAAPSRWRRRRAPTCGRTLARAVIAAGLDLARPHPGRHEPGGDLPAPRPPPRPRTADVPPRRPAEVTA